MEKALQQMQRDGASDRRLALYKTTAFGAIVRHSEKLGPIDCVAAVIDESIFHLRAEYERGEISQCKWILTRRGGEMLKQFHAAGTVEIPRCADWHRMNNPLRREPTPDEMNDIYNIFTITWQIKQEMLNFDLAYHTTRDYLSGFDYILRGHINNGLTRYSPELAAQLVDSARNDYADKIIRRSVCTTVRRIAAFIGEFYETGTITWRTLMKYGQREPQNEFAELLLKFCENAASTSNNKKATIANDRNAVRRFLFELEDFGIFSFDSVTHRIVSERAANLVRGYAGGLRRTIHSIRKFLKFLNSSGITKDDLSAAVSMNIPTRRPIHEGFSDDEIEKLLSKADTSTSCGKRDYAIMLLASQTGLRSCDISNLKLQDIDWRSNEIRIVQAKTGRALSLYLPTESGNAIADYILNARQKCHITNVFLCDCRPFRPIANASMGNIMKRYVRLAEIERSPKRPLGIHSFRRALGKRLLESETPIDMLSELLGHFSMNSSKPYVAINEDGLKKCALSLIPAVKDGDQLD
jgi:site-specific recombinase XerD